MNSVFVNADRQMQRNLEFWGQYQEDHMDEIFGNHLYELSKSRVLKKRFFSLTEKFLVKNKLGRQKMVPIEWKIVDPFIEENKSEVRYGFRLGHTGNYKDFYVFDINSLEKWIEKLSKVCIMTDIEDDYDFIKPIGKGRSAKIFLAERVGDMKKFAIKSIKKSYLLENSEFVDLLINEIKNMRKCNHPNIAKLHRVYESETHVHLVIDYAEGGDLFNRILQKKKFDDEAILRLSYKFMEVLEYLDSINIVHRDIKLENILMVSEGNDYDFKLADFGLSEEASGDLHKKCGSPGYIAPEILQGLPYGTKVDVFSFGIVLYILLTGKMPFNGKTSQDILCKNKDCKLNFQEIIWNYVPHNCLSFLVRLVQKDQNCRSTARDMLDHPWLSETSSKMEKIKTSPIIKSEEKREE
ncbi:unnamed protein product [Blepharisma stoltei]|uniref:Protein kinase domain-containing protein n=1 Tax=Blepharisma stoltei TaxID=1481888 RepID=A0AAU9JST9_9CILI|nr:unnamed protein product [Blepharisma stoltei]